MVRHRLFGSVRLALIGALLGTLLIATAGVVSAAASITATPGTAAPVAGAGNTFAIPFSTIALQIDVDCGGPASACSVWVTRNYAAKASEALFTNVTGARASIPVNFINDGCFNFRLYDSAHSTLLGQMNVGHPSVCGPNGSVATTERVNGSVTTTTGGPSGGLVAPARTPDDPSFNAVVDWDSGNFGGDNAEIWIDKSLPGGPNGYQSCIANAYPNGNEVLYTRGPSGELNGLNVLGGGPYCFTLYQGTTHTTRFAGPVELDTSQYLIYAASKTVYFNSANSATNATVCVYGTSIAGSSAANQTLLTFNSFGYGSTIAGFQTAGAANTYTTHFGVPTNGDGTVAAGTACTGGIAGPTTAVTT